MFIFAKCVQILFQNTVAGLHKQLLKLKNAAFVYHESDLPLPISIIILSASERGSHTEE